MIASPARLPAYEHEFMSYDVSSIRAFAALRSELAKPSANSIVNRCQKRVKSLCSDPGRAAAEQGWWRNAIPTKGPLGDAPTLALSGNDPPPLPRPPVRPSSRSSSPLMRSNSAILQRSSVHSHCASASSIAARADAISSPDAGQAFRQCADKPRRTQDVPRPHGVLRGRYADIAPRWGHRRA